MYCNKGKVRSDRLLLFLLILSTSSAVQILFLKDSKLLFWSVWLWWRRGKLHLHVSNWVKLLFLIKTVVAAMGMIIFEPEVSSFPGRGIKLSSRDQMRQLSLYVILESPSRVWFWSKPQVLTDHTLAIALPFSTWRIMTIPVPGWALQITSLLLATSTKDFIVVLEPCLVTFAFAQRWECCGHQQVWNKLLFLYTVNTAHVYIFLQKAVWICVRQE